jgi:peroxiredoxin Q/BCP
MAKALEPSDRAPNFTLARDGGDKTALKDFKGRKLVLYFYPKDDTKGCTQEAIAFTQALARFDKAGASVLGISKDSTAAHDKFKAKHGLKLALGSDPQGEMCEAYGVWTEKSMYGRTYMGIERSTFLIDSGGRIVQIWRKVKVTGHVEEVLKAAQAMAAPKD